LTPFAAPSPIAKAPCTSFKQARRHGEGYVNDHSLGKPTMNTRLDRNKFDITRLNDAIDRLLAVTTQPRHRFLLQAFYRHRFLELAGRYQEIFAPEMTVDAPVYNFNYAGIVAKLTGAEAVKGLYGMWAQTHQSIFYIEKEQIAVADNFVASVATAYQQMLGKALAGNGIPVDDEDAYYLYKTHGVEQIWPYDDRGRLVGEDVWETAPETSELIKLDPADVVTTERAAALLDPLIKPLPSFDEAVLGKARAPA
jgi:hypothetical protein